ncbi:MAG TPA: cbb3-type cytochrome c oxidase subunit 3 [Methylophilaceae bacterium]|nr:cbb3-type cytochrome c oxidase subunit 3 [Methylophilaceae bacterium]HWU82167.1 cbb3-type cytochrome c oxidase subunit 3 [Methylophilaceae bacterium]
MDINTLRILVTVVSFVLFVGIVIWAWRGRNTQDFRQAANLPFEEE